MKLLYKIWINQGGKAFGPGPYELLSKIQESGSINKASKELNMSYSNACKIINLAEERLGFKLLNRETGGNFGGGSYLTEEGKSFLYKYRDFMNEADGILTKLFNKYFL